MAAAPVPAEDSEVLTVPSAKAAHTGCLPFLEHLHHSKVAGTRLQLILRVVLPKVGK